MTKILLNAYDAEIDEGMTEGPGEDTGAITPKKIKDDPDDLDDLEELEETGQGLGTETEGVEEEDSNY